MIKNQNIRTFVVIITFCTSFCSSCKKFIEVNAPITSINQNNIYSNNSNAISAVTGIYTKLSSSDFSQNLAVFPDLSADNLSLYDENNSYAILYYQNKLNPRYQNQPSILWNDIYNYVYNCNSAIEGLTTTISLSEPIKKRLLGEVYFLRGFFYFYLVNLYESVPLALTTDYSKTAMLPNSPSELVYLQIVQDLKQAQTLLDETYVDGSLTNLTGERVRPNKMAATALLARVFLYTNNYSKAEEEATKVINNTANFTLSPINEVFLKNSSETIWALQPVAYNVNTMEGDFFIYSSEGPNSINYTFLSPNLIKNFEAGDLRKTEWIDSFLLDTKVYYYPFKYKIKNGDPSAATEYPIILRLSEQYLIRAEAKIQQGKIDDGIEDLNFLRRRARAMNKPDLPNPLPDLVKGLTKENAIDFVLKERRVELFTEWGNRWFDLKRTHKVDPVMTAIAQSKETIWESYQSIYPIPEFEISSNPNLKQNPGYK